MEEIFTQAVKERVLDAHIQYVIICTKDPNTSEPAHTTVYSLLVIMNDGQNPTETVFVYDISRTRQRAVEIAGLMCEYTVTPCTVHEVLDDIL